MTNKKKNYKKNPKNRTAKDIQKGIGNRDTKSKESNTGWEIREMLEDYRVPSWVSELEADVRRGMLLQAVKTFKENTGWPLVTAKDVVTKYRETGNWAHVVFEKENTLDKAFAKICGAKPTDFIKNQAKSVYDTAKQKNTPIISVNMALQIAIEYVQFLKKS